MHSNIVLVARELLASFKKELSKAPGALRLGKDDAWNALKSTLNDLCKQTCDNKDASDAVDLDDVCKLVASLDDRAALKADDFALAVKVETGKLFRGMKKLLEEMKKNK